MRSLEVSLTALPFDTAEQVEDFLWLLMTQKSLSEMQLARRLSKDTKTLAKIRNNTRMKYFEKFHFADIDEILESHIHHGKITVREGEGPVV